MTQRPKTMTPVTRGLGDPTGPQRPQRPSDQSPQRSLWEAGDAAALMEAFHC